MSSFPKDVAERYAAIQLELQDKTVSNKKRRKCEDDLERFGKEHSEFASTLTEMDTHRKQIQIEEDRLVGLEQYIDESIRRVCGVLIDKGFMESDGEKYRLTKSGTIASSIAEVHPLVLTRLLKQTNIFDSFVLGARNGMNTAVTVFPYILGMLVAISLFRNSGLFEILSHGLTWCFSNIGVPKAITESFPVALLRPFSSGGSRGFMIDAMRVYGPDSFTARLSCIFQCSAETTFYVVAVYFG